MHSTPIATISLSALVQNYHTLCGRLHQNGNGGCLWCVVKSNAYGHGLLPCVSALYHAGARHFAVGNVVEGAQVRCVCPDAKILVLGITDLLDLPILLDAHLIPTVPDIVYARALSKHLTRPLPIHIKVDCGMGRLGIVHTDFHSAKEDILAISLLPNIQINGIYAHLSEADDVNSIKTPTQIRLFSDLTKELQSILPIPHIHICASAGLLRFGAKKGQDARVGMALYGHSPSADILATSLLPALSLKAPILQIKKIAKGSSVGYGGKWTAPSDTYIGILPIGYGNGFLRRCEGGFVRVYGHRAQIVGRISMNYTTILLGNIPASVGNYATLFDKKGKQIKEFAAKANTIPYELLSALHGISYRYTRA